MLKKSEINDLGFKILSQDFYTYVSSIFKNIFQNAIISEQNESLIYECSPQIRGESQKISVELDFIEKEGSKWFDRIEVSSYSENLNEYDLSDFANSIIQKLFIVLNNKPKKTYCVRNYCIYFNRVPMQIDLVVHGAYKVRIHSYNFNSKRFSTEPLTEQILMFDTEIPAVDINDALSISYNNSNTLCSELSVLLDVGLKLLTSKYHIFVQNSCNGLTLNRYRTGFADFEWGLSVKNNLNGLTILADGNKKFMGNAVTTFMDVNQNRIGSTIIQNQNDNGNVEQVFLNHKIEKMNGITTYNEKIDVLTHFPSNEIKIPRQIRTYIRNIENLEANKKEIFLAATRLYNVSLLSDELGATISASYKVSCIDALAKSEKLSFSSFMQKYLSTTLDKKLLDYYFGTIRSGHFHSGEFYFNEYNVSMQFDTDFGFSERRESYLKFNNYIRGAIIAWINKNIVLEE